MLLARGDERAADRDHVVLADVVHDVAARRRRIPVEVHIADPHLDVVGDDLSTIGSGPTAPDPTSHAQALAVTSGLMADWQRKHPDQHWEMAQADNAGPSAAPTLAPVQGSASSHLEPSAFSA